MWANDDRRLGPVAQRRRARRAVRVLLALAVGTGWGFVAGVAPNPGPLSPAGADGPAPCNSGPPPFPFAGFCATFSGFNTFYGTYGPGFPGQRLSNPIQLPPDDPDFVPK